MEITNLTNLASEFKKLIEESEKIAIASHLNPDGDNLGSVTAMKNLLKKYGKTPIFILDDLIPSSFKFLPNIEENKSPEEVKDINFDLFITLDCSDTNRMGDNLKEIFEKSSKTINIDHHKTNENFADLNIVDPNSPATCELLYRVFENIDFELNKDIATSLYTGLSTDTGSFKYDSVNSETFRIASELVKYDISLNDIAVNVYQSRSIEKTNLLIRALNSIKYFCDNKIAIAIVTNKDMEETNAEKGDADGIVEFVRDTDGVELAVLLKEKEDCIRLSLRSKSEINCTKIASQFDGGGHVRASGGTIHHKDFDKAIDDIVKAAEEEL